MLMLFSSILKQHKRSLITCLLLVLAEKLSSLKDLDWNDFLHQACSLLDSTEKNPGTARYKLNLLSYLCAVAVHKEVASRLINSQLVNNKALKEEIWFMQHWHCSKNQLHLIILKQNKTKQKWRKRQVNYKEKKNNQQNVLNSKSIFLMENSCMCPIITGELLLIIFTITQ